MSEEEPPGPLEAPPKPKFLEGKYPEGRTFPAKLLDAWVSIPENEPLQIGPLTRDDIDHLLFSTSNIAQAIGELREGMIAASHGLTENASIHLANTLTCLIDGETHTRLLFEAIVKSIIKERKNGSK